MKSVIINNHFLQKSSPTPVRPYMPLLTIGRAPKAISTQAVPVRLSVCASVCESVLHLCISRMTGDILMKLVTLNLSNV